jgi:primosomal protein N' (replication factor Y)
MPTYVRVAVNIPAVTGEYDYHLPPELEGQVLPGCLVSVPFGQQLAQGIVTADIPTPEVAATKAVRALLDPLPAVTPTQMALAHWMSVEWMAPLSACLGVMLPPGLSQQADVLFTLNENRTLPEKLSPLQSRLIDLLKKRGALRGRQVDAAMPKLDWRTPARALVRSGAVSAQPVLPPPNVRPKVVRTAQLCCPLEEAQAALPNLGRTPASQSRRAAALQCLMAEPMPLNVAWVYAQSGCTLADLETLADADLVILSETEIIRDPLDEMDLPPLEAPRLTAAQQAVLERMQPLIHQAAAGGEVKPVLLRGVTGSGKTEIYLRAVEETLRLGRQAIVLVPEISLTPQTVRRFAGRFPGQVGLMHSRLSDGERYDTWRRVRSGRLPILVGPRSALFAPMPNLGLVVVDECHDASYDSDDFPPFYHAVEAAIELARISRAVVCLGSATPEITLNYRAQREQWVTVHLPDRIMAHRQVVASQMQRAGLPQVYMTSEGDSASLPLAPVQVVDMRQELQAGNRSIFSRALHRALGEVLAANQQAILLLNRRGAANHVACRTCGYVVRCPRCDNPLTYNEAPPLLTCHTCNYSRQMPNRCPECNTDDFREVGIGTQSVEQEVVRAFPQARVLRWDADTTRHKGAHDIPLAHFTHHRADILVGTQMLAKGLDLPFVTLVGVVLADVGLFLPDYRAGERVFALLTQVAGRAGRSPLGGRVVLQTYATENRIIQAAARQDYDAFYAEELAARRAIGYPPFSRLVRLEVRDPNPDRAESAARAMAHTLADRLGNQVDMIGPAPCYFARRDGQYRWHILLRGTDPRHCLDGMDLQGWRVQVDPGEVL